MAVARFAREYQTVRRAEGWGSPEGAYYRALPYTDLTGRFNAIWRIRARSYDTFVREALGPLEGATGRPRALNVLDVGAGSGWLSYRLAKRGHSVMAIDLLQDPLDGLGAARHFPTAFWPVLAEFDRLPLRDLLADLVVFNASFHYSTSYAATLSETLRVLNAGGRLVILDTPMYNDASSGARMVQERESRFLTTYGFASNALPSEHFLTARRLTELGQELHIGWQVHRPRLQLRDAASRMLNGLRARREPAHFPVIMGQRA
jgi:SAM-dependent methyltransferase